MIRSHPVFVDIHLITPPTVSIKAVDFTHQSVFRDLIKLLPALSLSGLVALWVT